MVEIIGDYVEPSELRIPKLEGTNQPTVTGSLFLSGAKAYIVTSSGTEAITSA